jgi:hypothetical protein
MRLFNRTCKVTIVRPASGFVGANAQFFEQLGNAIEVIEDRISFRVSKTLAASPNKCDIKIYNLSEHTRGELNANPIIVMLHAGYDGVQRLLFRGDLRYSRSRLQGADWITTLSIADGGRAYSYARMERSYKPPIQVKRVLEDAAKSMGLDLPPEIEQSSELRQALASGISTHGPSRDVLTRLLAPYGYSWSVQGGRLQILRDEQVVATEAVLVNESTGLLDSPEHAVPDKAGSSGDVTFEMMIYPELVPGKLAKLESRSFNGALKMLSVDHAGDTGGREWKSSVVGRPTSAIHF